MSLVEDSKKAREAGMTYGQYMLTHRPAGFETQVRTTARLRRCPVCGDLVFGSGKYCSPQCCNLAYKRRKKEHESQKR